jgi:hypothetical protein
MFDSMRICVLAFFLSVFALGLCLSASGAEDGDAKGKEKTITYRTSDLHGVGSLKINSDGTVTVSEAKQSALKDNEYCEYDLKNSKGGKKSSITLKEGESFSVSNKVFLRTYKFEGIEGEYAVFQEHFEPTRRAAKDFGFSNSKPYDSRCKVKAY